MQPNPFLLPSRLALRATGVALEIICICSFVCGVIVAGMVMQGGVR